MSNPLGGLARRASVQQHLDRKYPHRLVVDAGGWSERLNPDRPALRSQLFLGGLRGLGLQIANVAGHDLALGPQPRGRELRRQRHDVYGCACQQRGHPNEANRRVFAWKPSGGGKQEICSRPDPYHVTAALFSLQAFGFPPDLVSDLTHGFVEGLHYWIVPI